MSSQPLADRPREPQLKLCVPGQRLVALAAFVSDQDRMLHHNSYALAVCSTVARVGGRRHQADTEPTTTTRPTRIPRSDQPKVENA